MIEIKNLSYSVGDKTILKNITTTLRHAEFTAIIGANGSGKSTLAKHLNGLYIPTSGSVMVDGFDTASIDALRIVRSSVGMVFQDPSLQAVASIVIDDIAFAPEHMGLSPKETEERICRAMTLTRTQHLKNRHIATLSGGEKQLTAIAAVLAMNPRYIVFDEATSMLDGVARNSIFNMAKELCSNGIGIIWITQNLDEAELADTVVVMHNGEIALSDTPYNVFYENDISKYGLVDSQSIMLKKRFLLSDKKLNDPQGGKNNV